MLAAAGSGQRLGAGGPKALVDLGGRPMLEWSLEALSAAATVVDVVVAAPPGHEAEVEAVVGDRAQVIIGGASRADSVALAMEAVSGELVAIHDAARPLLTAELVDRLVGRLNNSEADGVIAAARVSDTLKRAGEGDGDVISETVSRDGLWAAQTPQVFRVRALLPAQLAALERGDFERATDEAWLIEREGGTVLLEEAREPNLKVTDAGDLRIAEALLAARG